MTAWWCTRAGLATVVDASDEDAAKRIADRAFSGRTRRTVGPELVTARVADGADLALWAQLLAQDAAGIDGARVADLPDVPTWDAPDLFGGV